MEQYIDAVVIKVDDVDTGGVKTIDDLGLIEAVRGIYWAVAFHNDKPKYKQEPPDSAEILSRWHTGPTNGWCITDQLFDSKHDMNAVTTVKGNNDKQLILFNTQIIYNTTPVQPQQPINSEHSINAAHQNINTLHHHLYIYIYIYVCGDITQFVCFV